MAKTSGEFEKEFIQQAQEKTGKSVNEWLPLIKKSGLMKTMEIANWLKTQHGFNHMQATLLAGLYLNNGKPVYQDETSLLENQFVKCASMRPLFDKLEKLILKNFNSAQLIAKKTYLSFTETREFAAVNIKPNELRVGLDLGEMPFSDFIQKSKLSGPMPRMSHMVVISSADELNDQLLNYLQQSYNRSHKK